MNLAPVTLFVYNRPEHTRRTIEALRNNNLASVSDLMVYSDAPKNTESADAVSEVREYIRTIFGFKSVTIIERERNWGLANSIIDGVTSVVNKYGRVIVLEDDLVTSPYFLDFMNTALDEYRDDEKVMHISGYMFPIDNTNLPETFFLRTASCWGWATWDRAWRHFEKDPKRMLGGYSKQTINRFNMDGAFDFWTQVELNAKGAMDTWAIFWYASVFQNGGLCLHPKVSMVNNIGHDATGEHCRVTNDYLTILASRPVKYFEKNIFESSLALARTNRYFLTIDPSIYKPRLIHRIFAAILRRIHS